MWARTLKATPEQTRKPNKHSEMQTQMVASRGKRGEGVGKGYRGHVPDDRGDVTRRLARGPRVRMAQAGCHRANPWAGQVCPQEGARVPGWEAGAGAQAGARDSACARCAISQGPASQGMQGWGETGTGRTWSSMGYGVEGRVPGTQAWRGRSPGGRGVMRAHPEPVPLGGGAGESHPGQPRGMRRPLSSASLLAFSRVPFPCSMSPAPQRAAPEPRFSHLGGLHPRLWLLDSAASQESSAPSPG